MLNLLIAIMGDTFDRVLDAQEEAQMKQVCEFTLEYEFLIKDEDFTDNIIIYATNKSPDEDEDSEAWEGKISALRSFITKKINLL